MNSLVITALLIGLLLPHPAQEQVEPRGVWPLGPRHVVVAAFDPPATRWGRGHRGVDLLGRVGQQVHAARAGTVRFVGRIGGKPVIVVGHGATRTTYEPVRAVVEVGARVPAGAVIGQLRGSPSHCWPRACLHWGLLRGRTYLDPLTLVWRQVRLLPLG